MAATAAGTASATVAVSGVEATATRTRPSVPAPRSAARQIVYGGAVRESNWAGTYVYSADRIQRPGSVEQLREIVARAPSVHVLGSRHAFNGIADAPDLVSLDALPVELEVDSEAGTVSFRASLRYGELARALEPHGLALHNLASLPHISVAGAVATGTHGSGDRSGSLATAVAALELVTSDGDLLTARRGDPDFDGLVVGLGALGAVTRITLDVEPDYEVRQRVYEGLGWDALCGRFDELTACGDSVSVFTHWGAEAGQLWVKQRVGRQSVEGEPGSLFGATPATVERHPILGLDPVSCTPQLGVPGGWAERLPHFRMGFTPSSGEEIQSEYLLPRRHALAAIEALRALAPTVGPLLLVSEIRTVAADGLWLSPEHGRDTVALHFTWRREPEAVLRELAKVEAALEPFDPRPHWGKVFLAEAAALAPRYPRAGDFCSLVERLDPRGAFRTPWLERHLLGATPPASAVRVAVRSGGTLREAIGVRRTVHLDAGATVADLLTALAGQPGLAAGALDRVAVSVGGAIVPHAHRLTDGDEVALVPPVAGG
jgi:xylitol oxidase